MIPAAVAAAIATPRDAQGYGESITSICVPRPSITPGSGTFNSAESKLLDQLSMVFCKTV